MVAVECIDHFKNFNRQINSFCKFNSFNMKAWAWKQIRYLPYSKAVNIVNSAHGQYCLRKNSLPEDIYGNVLTQRTWLLSN